jgi:hypothetical protein
MILAPSSSSNYSEVIIELYKQRSEEVHTSELTNSQTFALLMVAVATEVVTLPQLSLA